MDVSPTALELLVELWLSILKFLGRPAVQRQIIAGLLVLLAAGGLAHQVTRRYRNRRDARRQNVADALRAEARAHLRTIDDMTAENPAAEQYTQDDRLRYVRLLDDDDALAAAVDQRVRGRRGLLVQPLLFPAAALLLLVPIWAYFQFQGWVDGILTVGARLLGLFLLYRLALGVAYATAEPARVHYYRYRLFGPLLTIAVTLFVLSVFGDLRALSAAPVLTVGDQPLTLGALGAATFGFYVYILFLSLSIDVISAIARTRIQVSYGSLEAGLTLVQYALVALGLFAVLRVLQVNAATVAAVTGGLSIGIGFALQDVLKNFLGGIIILFEGAVRPGDWVEVAGTEGRIDKLSIRSTVVRTPDNVEYIVPNQDWLNSVVTTLAHTNQRVPVKMTLAVSTTEDPRYVRRLLIEGAQSMSELLTEPRPGAALVDYNGAALNFVVFGWVADIEQRAAVTEQMRFHIWERLLAHDIQLRVSPEIT